MSNQLDS